VTDRALRIAIALLALAGLGVAGYLTYVHYAGIDPVCAIAHGCVKVQTSHWAKLAGVPVAVLGLLGYAGILASLAVRGEGGRLAGAGLAFAGFGFSAYLTYVELFEIKAVCAWCVVSAGLMTALAALTAARVLTADPEGPDLSREATIT
jgi:uncharacterized membrane protein